LEASLDIVGAKVRIMLAGLLCHLETVEKGRLWPMHQTAWKGFSEGYMADTSAEPYRPYVLRPESSLCEPV
jgi:hypothetical protein